MLTNNISNIRLSEYLGHIMRELSTGRVMADRESMRIAEAYAKDGLMKFFPAPRFVISEMELDLPFVMDKVEYNTITKLNLEKHAFVNKATAELNEVLERYNSPFRMESPEMADILFNLHMLYYRMAICQDPVAMSQVLQAGYSELFNRVVAKGFDHNAQQSLSESSLQLREIDYSLTQLHNFVSDHRVVEEAKLQNLFINPMASALKEAGGDTMVVRIKMKVREETASIVSAKDDEGVETKMIQLN